MLLRKLDILTVIEAVLVVSGKSATRKFARALHLLFDLLQGDTTALTTIDIMSNSSMLVRVA